MIFKYPFLNVLFDDLYHAIGHKKFSLYHCQWVLLIFIGFIGGIARGAGMHGWLGAIIGGVVGFLSGFLVGWLFFIIGVLTMRFVFRFLHRRGWFVLPDSSSQPKQ